MKYPLNLNNESDNDKSNDHQPSTPVYFNPNIQSPAFLQTTLYSNNFLENPSNLPQGYLPELFPQSPRTFPMFNLGSSLSFNHSPQLNNLTAINNINQIPFLNPNVFSPAMNITNSLAQLGNSNYSQSVTQLSSPYHPSLPATPLSFNFNHLELPLRVNSTPINFSRTPTQEAFLENPIHQAHGFKIPKRKSLQNWYKAESVTSQMVNPELIKAELSTIKGDKDKSAYLLNKYEKFLVDRYNKVVEIVTEFEINLKCFSAEYIKYIKEKYALYYGGKRAFILERYKFIEDLVPYSKIIEKLGLTPTQLTVIFKKFHGVTYFHKKREEKERLQIEQEQNNTLKEIAPKKEFKRPKNRLFKPKKKSALTRVINSETVKFVIMKIQGELKKSLYLLNNYEDFLVANYNKISDIIREFQIDHQVFSDSYVIYLKDFITTTASGTQFVEKRYKFIEELYLRYKNSDLTLDTNRDHFSWLCELTQRENFQQQDKWYTNQDLILKINNRIDEMQKELELIKKPTAEEKYVRSRMFCLVKISEEESEFKREIGEIGILALAAKVLKGDRKTLASKIKLYRAINSNEPGEKVIRSEILNGLEANNFSDEVDKAKYILKEYEKANIKISNEYCCHWFQIKQNKIKEARSCLAKENNINEYENISGGEKRSRPTKKIKIQQPQPIVDGEDRINILEEDNSQLNNLADTNQELHSAADSNYAIPLFSYQSSRMSPVYYPNYIPSPDEELNSGTPNYEYIEIPQKILVEDSLIDHPNIYSNEAKAPKKARKKINKSESLLDLVIDAESIKADLITKEGDEEKSKYLLCNNEDFLVSNFNNIFEIVKTFGLDLDIFSRAYADCMKGIIHRKKYDSLKSAEIRYKFIVDLFEPGEVYKKLGINQGNLSSIRTNYYGANYYNKDAWTKKEEFLNLIHNKIKALQEETANKLKNNTHLKPSKEDKYIENECFCFVKLSREDSELRKNIDKDFNATAVATALKLSYSSLISKIKLYNAININDPKELVTRNEILEKLNTDLDVKKLSADKKAEFILKEYKSKGLEVTNEHCVHYFDISTAILPKARSAINRQDKPDVNKNIITSNNTFFKKKDNVLKTVEKDSKKAIENSLPKKKIKVEKTSQLVSDKKKENSVISPFKI